jgi:integrase/recombinase XerD
MFAKDALKEFKLECEIKKFSEKTIKGYFNNNALFINYCEKELKTAKIEDINKQHIKQYIQFLTQNKLKETYINGIIKCLRAFFKYCLSEEYIKQNPALKIGWQREPTVIIKAFSNEEVAKMLKVEGNTHFLTIRNRALIAMLFDTGIRCMELCDLKDKDIKDNYISISNGKGKKERHVGKSPILEKCLLKYDRCKELYFKDKFLKTDYFFMSRTGRPLTVTGVEKIIQTAGIKAGVRPEIRCSPHTCRHYFAQTQLKNGLDVYSLSRILGHENISITKRYLQSIQDQDVVKMSIKTSPLMNL